MKIGFDMDGVLSDFYTPYENLIVEIAGVDLFPGRFPAVFPTTWNWPEAAGYDDKTVAAAWERIKTDPVFWTKLGPLPGMSELIWAGLDRGHELTFITTRPGIATRDQTRTWLETRGIDAPQVIVTHDKGTAARLLELDVYIDDKGENVQDVQVKSPLTRVYMLDRPYNTNTPYINRRVTNISQMIMSEGL